MGSDRLESNKTEQLLRLLAAHQEDLFRYVFSLLPNQEDCKDVLQETYVALTRKFDDFDPAKPFLPWAFGFAYMEVLKHRERQARAARVFSDEIVALLAQERTSQEPAWNARLAALEPCLDKLPDADRRLIAHRYLARTTIEQLADIAGSSRRTLFRNLERIRRLLYDCISRRLEEIAV